MSDEKDTMALWNQVCTTPKDYTSGFDNKRFKGTSVDATYQKQRATGLWGPYGSTWGLRGMEFKYIVDSGGVPIEIFLRATFFYPGGEFEIAGNHSWHKGHDHIKILQTEVLKKALTYLGFSADIYLGAFDDDGYVRATGGDTPQEQKVEEIVSFMKTAPDDKTINKYMLRAQNMGLSSFYLSRVRAAADARNSELQAESTFD